MPGSWLTINEVAEATGLGVKTVKRLINSGQLPAYKIGKMRLVRIAAADIDSLMVRIPADEAGRA